MMLIVSQPDANQVSVLSTTCTPQHANEYDVVCGRGLQAFNNGGNRRLRSIVKNHLSRYSQASSKIEKSFVVSDIIGVVRSEGEFVKQNTRNGYFEKVSERMAREKVGQALRGALHTTYKSSTISRKRRRIAEQRHQDVALLNIINGNKQVTGVLRAVAEKVNVDAPSDATMTALFLAANMRILKEFKESNCAEVFSDACDCFGLEGDSSDSDNDDRC